MGYLHINNLYKDKTIFLFKECYALEKIHGTSAHISWNCINKTVNYYSGGEKLENFLKLFNLEFIKEKFEEKFSNKNVVIFGELYGGKQQGMAHTYGKELKFIGFDVKIENNWLNVPNAEEICNMFNIEFVSYERVEVTIENLDRLRDMPSIQAIRNGMGNDKKREGIVIRPIIEMKLNNGDRVIVKHKADSFRETNTPRKVDLSSDKLEVLDNTDMIVNEWVTEMRLEHILQKISNKKDMSIVGDIIKLMIEDVLRESQGEIIVTKDLNKKISAKTVKLYKNWLANNK